MYSTITSGALRGIDSYLTSVEVDTAMGLPGFDMVGYLSNEVKEARERVRVALRNAGMKIPPVRVTVNVSPANIRKEGPAFDLPIAIGILQSLELMPQKCTDRLLLIGELGLNGQVRCVKGVLPIVLEAKKRGIEVCLIPEENYGEGSCAEGIRIYGIANLSAAIDYLRQSETARQSLEATQRSQWESTHPKNAANSFEEDFSQMNGQESMKRAALIAAAGFHHLLMCGPPGSGKTMLARRLRTILPPLSYEESLEVSKIYSVAGLLSEQEPLIRKRPFYNPHHTISEIALAGGGRIPKPGVISLAHRGLLFLDELPEFRRETLEIMRQPLEEKEIHIARSSGNYSYPSSFLLVAAMNPCPCGYYPDRNRCSCTENEIRRYRGRISGPLLDRIDLKISAPKIEFSELTQHRPGMCSAVMAEQVNAAQKLQKERFAGSAIRFNSEMKNHELTIFCALDDVTNHTAQRIFNSKNLSARSYQKMLRVARTIADLEGSEKIQEHHIIEASVYML